MAFKARLDLALAATFTNPMDLASRQSIINWSKGIGFPVGDSSADLIWHDQRTLGASVSENIDLAGVLGGLLGAATITFAYVSGVIVYALPANTNNVVLSRPAANGFLLFSSANDAISIQPGGLFAWTDPGVGTAVVAGTADLLTLTNSAGGTSVTYDLIVWGTSA